MPLRIIALVMIVIMVGCSVGKQAERRVIRSYDRELSELVESWYETRWNSENNMEGEMDSIEMLIIDRMNTIK